MLITGLLFLHLVATPFCRAMEGGLQDNQCVFRYLRSAIRGRKETEVTEDEEVEDNQTLAELSSAHRCSQAKCHLVQTSYIKRNKLFFFAM